jgi:hypothetical protein
MNIAELFVNMGIKGAEKTVGALTSVRKGMGEIKDTSIEAKAAIVGAMYGLERMMAISGAAGTNLTNFGALTGQSAQALQQWQFAARQAGVSSEELTGSVKSVQNAMTNMLLNKGAPAGMKLLSDAVGGISPEKYTKPFEMMKILQQGIQKMTPEMAQMVGKSFGLSEGTISAMKRNMFTPDMLNKAPKYSDKEIASLDKSNIAWANLGNTIQMAFGHFNAKHGQQLVGDISKLVPQVLKLVEAFVKLSETLHLFEGFGKMLEGWTSIFKGLSGAVTEVASDKKGTLHGVWDKIKGGATSAVEVYKGIQISERENMAKSSEDLKKRLQNEHSWLAPKVQPQPQQSAANVTNINQNITHHGDAKDTEAVKDTHKSGINHAFRTLSAQGQGS